MKKELTFTIDELHLLTIALSCLINESCDDTNDEEEDLFDKICATIEELEKDNE